MNTIAVVLAGGEGRRLHPLTSNRMKALVPFCNACVLVDFALSNIANSGIKECIVVVQDAQFVSMRDYLEAFARNATGCELRLWCLCPALLEGGALFSGTADALLRALRHVFAGRSQQGALAYVCGADHVYLFDVRNAVRFHTERNAVVTVIGGHIPIAEASRYGVLSVDRERRVIRLDEKPRVPCSDPLDPGRAVVSMGDYLFNVKSLLAHSPDPAGMDVASHLIPTLLEASDCRFFDFEQFNRIGNRQGGSVGYWRDIGTIDSYWQTSMDVLSSASWVLDGLQGEWPLHSGLQTAGGSANREDWPGSAISAAARLQGDPRFARCVVMAGASVIGDVALEDAIVTETAVVDARMQPAELEACAAAASGRVRVFHD